MENFVEVKGILYNTGVSILCVDKVQYDRYDDKYSVCIQIEGSNRYGNSFDQTFKTEIEATEYRDEFVNKMCR